MVKHKQTVDVWVEPGLLEMLSEIDWCECRLPLSPMLPNPQISMSNEPATPTHLFCSDF